MPSKRSAAKSVAKTSSGPKHGREDGFKDKAVRPRRRVTEKSPLQTAVQRLESSLPVAPFSPSSLRNSVIDTLVNRSRHTTSSGVAKLMLLDTNVIMHDPTCITRFEDNDIYLCTYVLEELDNHKKGKEEINRNVRKFQQALLRIVQGGQGSFTDGFSLEKESGGVAKGRLFIQTEPIQLEISEGHANNKVDNYIIALAQRLQEKEKHRPVVLVTKDVFMTVKALAQKVRAEDYKSDKVMEDTDLLWSGYQAMPADFWEKYGDKMESWQENGFSFYRFSGPHLPVLLVNCFLIENDGSTPPRYYRVVENGDRQMLMRTIHDFTHQKNNIWGIVARNPEQNFALNALMNPDIYFVSLLGQAGTGKTLLTLAAALHQTLELKIYTEIIFTRVTVPVGEDIGFLPGTEEEKMNPWMGALDDNLDVLNKPNEEAGEWGKAATRDLMRSRIKVKSLNFMRGRTFINKFLIIDEAQNLTPKQMKTLITRAGPGTKVVCLGNIAQIDTPYLTEGSSGITYVVERFKGWLGNGHVTLQRGERSPLADYAAKTL